MAHVHAPEADGSTSPPPFSEAPQAEASAPPSGSGEPLRRRLDEGLIGGVCAGLARRLQVNATAVRLVAAVTVGFGGVGLVLYSLAWALVPIADDDLAGRRREGAWKEALRIVIAIVALLALLRWLGVGLGQTILWPLVTGGCGLALVWRPAIGAQPHLSGHSGPLRERLRGANVDVPRVVLGALLVAFASASLLHHFEVLHTLGKAIGAVAIIATIGAVLVLPWFVRLARSLASERAGRIREQERAEVAAHLHDSVLQTLALIQKRAADPREVAGLARRQERELRSWLQERPAAEGGGEHGRRSGSGGGRGRGAPRRADRGRHGWRRAAWTTRLEALVGAAREAMTNAAKFAGASGWTSTPRSSQGRAEVFVRDRGVGFDPQARPGGPARCARLDHRAHGAPPGSCRASPASQVREQRSELVMERVGAT